ncbi:unnamed protein product (macronuclear) [Paramecium tetraurelia]|uniref:Uncharacterized protein n=1 Tax=Paramecium tetraurelia TaxID=5888 RepID=A0DJU2_PARTE|nr:uncharacterized protein GSPATT00017653001 [Paramecium tetraurelia]CAK83309.1 unnamed protein product [Paramecium tetraurelia]
MDNSFKQEIQKKEANLVIVYAQWWSPLGIEYFFLIKQQID